MERFNYIYPYDENITLMSERELYKSADEAETWNEFSLTCLREIFWRHDLDMDEIWETEDMEDPCELQKYIEPYVREEN